MWLKCLKELYFIKKYQRGNLDFVICDKYYLYLPWTWFFRTVYLYDVHDADLSGNAVIVYVEEAETPSSLVSKSPSHVNIQPLKHSRGEPLYKDHLKKYDK